MKRIFSPDVLLSNQHWIEGDSPLKALGKWNLPDPDSFLRALQGNKGFPPIAKATTHGVSMLPASGIRPPTLNPYLQTENLSLGRLVYNDCVELRKRIESLQIDIFNLDQTLFEFEEKALCRTNDIKRLEDSLSRTESTITLRTEDIGRAENEVRRVEARLKDYGPDSATQSVTKRSADKVTLQFWPLVFGSTTGGQPTLSAYTNADAQRRSDAGLAADLPFSSTFNALSAEAIFAAKSEVDAIQQSVQLAINNLSALKAEHQALESTRAGLELQIAGLKKSHATDEEIIRRKRAQFSENGTFNLKRRLQDSLVLYDDLLGTLRQTLFAVEYGQALIFGCHIDGFDAGSQTRSNRYIFTDMSQIQPTADLPSLDETWISLDRLGLYLSQAEARYRQIIQRRRYKTQTIRVDGNLDANGDLKRAINLSERDNDNLVRKSSRIVGFSITNLGDPIDLSMKISNSFENLNDVDAEFLKGFSAELEASSLHPPPIQLQPIQVFDTSSYINRAFSGVINISAHASESESKLVRLRLNIVFADEGVSSTA
ncbi:hypothetical protein [Pseudorhodoferax sp.]|uniref:hypothetical protein n=1 Tax=Pseudorhodoferax sp. TaxID=1993553 RepID=UPI0039E41345